MSGEVHELPLSAGILLIAVGAGADTTKFALEYFLGIGLVLDPLLISPVTALIFWVVHVHNDVPMFSGKRAAAAWINLAVAETPAVDALPDWTVYAAYLTFAPRVAKVLTEPK
jgi:hypothetical protein